MKYHIGFRSRVCKTFKARILPGADFQEIINTLNDLLFYASPIDKDHIIYSVLELVNNSLRAHRENGIEDSVEVRFWTSPERLVIQVEDRGGGFDPGRLPYNLEEEAERIDPNSPEFAAYREKNGYLRFGMGLYIAKKTFDGFSLRFRSRDGDLVVWGENGIIGTMIEMVLEYENGTSER